MFLMIFVNDLWTLQNIPAWLEHSKAEDDAMGLADTIFPAFLFIVGLSIPFAISNRMVKGDSRKTIIIHIFERFIALLVMGLFTVNLENANSEAMIINKFVWQIIMVLAFFLIWNVYPKDKSKRYIFNGLKICGYLILLGLALIYKGGDAENITWMKIHWWGILGLIAWSYVICSLLYLLIRDHVLIIALSWIFFIAFNIAAFAGWLDIFSDVKEYVWIVGNGAMPGFTMAGVLASVIYRNKSVSLKTPTYLWILFGLGVTCLIIGFALRPFWEISKIRETPAWLGICSGISFLAYVLFFWFIDIKRKKDWFQILKPAGVATLTCYLIPYLWYAIVTLLEINLPEVLLIGWIGIVKSLFFALIIILITGGLNRLNIKLKV
jgi:heparan-alpha-glucosaminide N-acetyltransferase